ncbi:hypothetical protein X975_23241, partial [Stegodyphus mimosarum]
MITCKSLADQNLHITKFFVTYVYISLVKLTFKSRCSDYINGAYMFQLRLKMSLPVQFSLRLCSFLVSEFCQCKQVLKTLR